MADLKFGCLLLVATPAAAAAATTTATATATATLGAWFRFVDIQRASIQLLAIKATNGSNSLVLCRHLYKRKTSRLSAVLVRNNADG